MGLNRLQANADISVFIDISFFNDWLRKAQVVYFKAKTT